MLKLFLKSFLLQAPTLSVLSKQAEILTPSSTILINLCYEKVTIFLVIFIDFCKAHGHLIFF